MSDVIRKLPRGRRGLGAQGRRPNGRRRFEYAAAPLIAAVVLVGCGGGSASSKPASPPTTVGGAAGAPGGGASLKKFQDCLAQHGVTIPSTTPGGTFPRGGPGAGASGTPGTPPGGSAPSAAIQACQSLAPAGFGPGPAGGQQALQAFVSCMSDHGVKLTATDPSLLSTVDRTSSAYKSCSALLPSVAAPLSIPTTTTP